MRRTLRIVVAAGLLAAGGWGLASGPPAAAQEQAPSASGSPEPAEVARAIVADGWYVDADAEGDRERLAATARRLSSGGQTIGIALLAAEPPGSSTTYAERVLDALPGQGAFGDHTVVVLSPDDVGVVSDVWEDQAIDEALDDTIDRLRADPVEGVDALADALARQPTIRERESEADDGVGGVSTALLVVLGVGLVGVLLLSRLFGGGPREWDDGGEPPSSWGSSYYRRRTRSFRSSSPSRFRSSRSSRRSSSGSRRGRGGRRL